MKIHSKSQHWKAWTSIRKIKLKVHITERRRPHESLDREGLGRLLKSRTLHLFITSRVWIPPPLGILPNPGRTAKGNHDYWKGRCHLRRYLKHERTDSQFLFTSEGSQSRRGNLESLVSFFQQITVCVIIHEYLKLKIVSVGLQTTQAFFSWWDFHLEKSQQSVKMTAKKFRGVPSIWWSSPSCDDNYPWE